MQILNDQNLADKLKTSSFSIIYFSNLWCGPCKMYGPFIEKYSQTQPDIFFGKIDCDENNESVLKYGIRSIPCTIFIKNGEIVEKKTGILTENQLNEIIEKNK